MALAEAPLGQHVKGSVIIRLGSVEDGIRHRHWRGGANQQRSNAIAMRGGALERNQAAFVAYQRRIGNVECVQHCNYPAAMSSRANGLPVERP